jgi:hypothetical protein
VQTATQSDALARFGYALSYATRTEILLMLRDGHGYGGAIPNPIAMNALVAPNLVARAGFILLVVTIELQVRCWSRLDCRACR